MEVMDATQIMGGWLNEGLSSLSTVEDCGWPCRVADIVLVIKDRKVKEEKCTPIS